MNICDCKAKEMIRILLQSKLDMYVIIFSCINVAQKIQFKKDHLLFLEREKNHLHLNNRKKIRRFNPWLTSLIEQF